jgi:DNA polymerase-3 subunit gamma/tau
MLLKGLGETQSAPAPLRAAEMVLIRLIYAGDLPTPGELVKRLSARDGPPVGAAPSNGPGAEPPPSQAPPPVDQGALAPSLAPAPAPELESLPAADGETRPQPHSFAELVELVQAKREVVLANHLAGDVHLVHFEPGRIELRPGAAAPRDLAGGLGRLLEEWTGRRWVVSVSDAPGAATLRSQHQEAEAGRRAAALQAPLVQAALQRFPGAKLVARRDAAADGGQDQNQGGEGQ